MNRKNEQYKFFLGAGCKKVLRFEVDVSPAKAWAALIDTDQFTKLFCGGNGNGVRTKGECGAVGARYTFTETKRDDEGKSYIMQSLFKLKEVDPERMTVIFTHKVLVSSNLVSDRVEKYSIMKIEGELRKSIVELRNRTSWRDFPIIAPIAAILMWFIIYLVQGIKTSRQVGALVLALEIFLFFYGGWVIGMGCAAQKEYWERNHFVNSALGYFAMYTPNTEDTV
eukprot:snap_masked-scaffold_39-processed-gene-0.10-mRNA-1 protein AED:1.00 eAED:1.00 QI:0/-1/0/0/-1/1/1/0/224